MEKEKQTFAEIKAKYPNLVVSFDSYYKHAFAYKGSNEEISISIGINGGGDIYRLDMPKSIALKDICVEDVYDCEVGKSNLLSKSIGEKLDEAFDLFSEMKNDNSLATDAKLNLLDNSLFNIHGHIKDLSRSIGIFRVSLLKIEAGRYFMYQGKKFVIIKVYSEHELKACRLYKNGNKSSHFESFNPKFISETFDK